MNPEETEKKKKTPPTVTITLTPEEETKFNQTRSQASAAVGFEITKAQHAKSIFNRGMKQ